MLNSRYLVPHEQQLNQPSRTTVLSARFNEWTLHIQMVFKFSNEKFCRWSCLN
uniref:Uncharacterized protein n=1 Tax=Anguilla anguilla TaxID=7936 RepID=A0A0E9RH98_ANGAN